jgi:hypothetical protein
MLSNMLRMKMNKFSFLLSLSILFSFSDGWYQSDTNLIKQHLTAITKT